MRKNIKDYIDYSWELSENIIPLASTTPDKNFTDSDRKNYKTNRSSETKRYEFP